MIIAERPTNLIIRTKRDEYVHRPNDSYNKLKYGTFQANRIFHEWDSEARVEETFNERIFNCIYKEERLQLRKANDICKAILTKNKEDYVELFKSNYYDLHKAQLLDSLIKDNSTLKGRVKRTKDDEYIVDDVFKVDGRAITYVLDTHRIKNSKRVKKWNHLCTVIGKEPRVREILTKEIGVVKVDKATLKCLAKIFCLIRPHTWDSIIWNQIPKWLQRIYKDEYKLDDKFVVKT